ncbi:hypothetical protein AKO1_001036 [Acrasis kona]|uniref:Uncharacterized protein n=1 Tax=Acrasis kona TaxID=1008807 RepID=A0AAW2ZCX9_9EUKA
MKGRVYVVIYGLVDAGINEYVQKTDVKTGHAAVIIDVFGHSDDTAIRGLRSHLIWDPKKKCWYEVSYDAVKAYIYECGKISEEILKDAASSYDDDEGQSYFKYFKSLVESFWEKFTNAASKGEIEWDHNVNCHTFVDEFLIEVNVRHRYSDILLFIDVTRK